MILGLDNGYHFTKTSEGVIFPSTIKSGKDIDINKDTIQLEVREQDYIIGAENGQYVADINKIDSLVTELCTFTAIGMSFKEKPVIDVEIVAGLPVSYYSKQKEQFIDKLLSYGDRRIKINNKGYQDIRITAAQVYPQSVGAVFLNAKDAKNDDSLVIDVGGGTICVSFFHGLRMMDHRTYEMGMLVLYSQLAQKINSDHDCKFNNYQLDEKFQKGYITTDTGKVYLTKYDDDIKSHVNIIASTIKRDFNTKAMDNVYVIGGGGIRLYDKLKEEFKTSVLLDNSQFVNANAFKFMGEMKKR